MFVAFLYSLSIYEMCVKFKLIPNKVFSCVIICKVIYWYLMIVMVIFCVHLGLTSLSNELPTVSSQYFWYSFKLPVYLRY